MGNKEWFQVCSPHVQSPTFHCTRIPTLEIPNYEDWKHASASGGVNELHWAVVGLIQEAHQCANTVQGGSQPHLRCYSFEVGRRQTHFWCCTRPLFAPSWTMVSLGMTQHWIQIYYNWTASITLDRDWHWERSATAHCPGYTQRPMKLLWRNVN